MYHAMKTKKNFNYDNFFVRFSLKRHRDLNVKKHKTKNKQIVKRALFQQICNIMSRTKK